MQLIPEQHHSLGSVEGRLETISVHRRPQFTIYLSRTRKAVTCRIAEDDLFQAAMHALGQRVLAAGIVHANARGEPVSVDAGRLRIFRNADELPKTSDLYGIDPDFTGGASSDEYVRSLRGA